MSDNRNPKVTSTNAALNNTPWEEFSNNKPHSIGNRATRSRIMPSLPSYDGYVRSSAISGERLEKPIALKPFAAPNDANTTRYDRASRASSKATSPRSKLRSDRLLARLNTALTTTTCHRRVLRHDVFSRVATVLAPGATLAKLTRERPNTTGMTTCSFERGLLLTECAAGKWGNEKHRRRLQYQA